jgi:hypothetical protein
MPSQLGGVPSRWLYPEVRNIPIVASAWIGFPAHGSRDYCVVFRSRDFDDRVDLETA